MRFFLLLIALTSFSYLNAQDTNYVDPNYQGEKQKKQKKRRTFGESIYFGGTFGLQFGTVNSILIEPMIGYKISERLSAGIGLGIRYGKDNRYKSPIEYTNYLGRVFTRLKLIPKLYAHAEFMAESYDKVFYFEGQDPNHNGRTVVPFLFVGGGYRAEAGNGSFIFQILFNVLQSDPYSRQVYPSGTPYISLGYIGGF